MLSARQSDVLALQLKHKLEPLPISALAAESHFVRRQPRKIDPLNFLLGFFFMAVQGASSLRSLAAAVGCIANCTISKQAIDKRIKQPLLVFLKLALAASLAHSIQAHMQVVTSQLSSVFNRVLVQDSTTIRLNAKLVAAFPGSRNSAHKSFAILKIQTLYELFRERFCFFQLTAFTKNDQEAAHDVVPLLQARDLLIRDLGYLTLSVLSAIQGAEAYFLSRFKYGICLYEANTGEPLDLLKLLKHCGHADIDVYAGAKEQLRVRMVAIPVSAGVAAERRRRAKRNRDQRLHPSHEPAVAGLYWDGTSLSPISIARS